jgi:hypothetical protein
MHSAIFVVKMPGEFDRQSWPNFLGDIEPKLRNTPTKRLAENVWQVSFQESPAALAWLVALADRRGLTYGILPLDAAPQWLPDGVDPNTK